MANFCLPKEEAKSLRDALTRGIITPDQLVRMTSEQRRSLLAEYVGTENAPRVNAELESKFFLKDYKAGLVRHINRMTDVPKPYKQDMIRKIEALDEWLEPMGRDRFLADLASRRLGFEVTYDQMKGMTEIVNRITEKEQKVQDQIGGRSQEEYLEQETATELKNRLDLGVDKNKLNEYISEIRHGNPTAMESLKDVYVWAGTAKALKASVDVSFPGRQGWSVLMNNPTIWAKGTADGMRAFAKALGGNKQADIAVRAEILSRPNALNGKYDATKVSLGLAHEEIFPTSLPSKVPFFGRVYAASEAAYTASALRMRADLADIYIKIAEENGINVLQNKKQAEAFGQLANSMTGRGKLPFGTERAGDVFNVTFFSPRNFMANIDILTGHMGGARFEAGPGGKVARKIAAMNTLRTILGTAAVLASAETLLGDDAVEWDPRATDFGRIRIGNIAYDVSGGMASVPRLAARLAKNSYIDSRGRLRELGTDYGQLSSMDMFWQFTEGKFSPIAAMLRDILNRSHFMGEPLTPDSLARQALLPIMIEQMYESSQSDEDFDVIFISLILEALGIGIVNYN